MKKTDSKFVKFLSDFTDEKRYPIVADNEDVEEAKGAMEELEHLRAIYMADLGGEEFANSQGTLLETVYAKGFLAGKEAQRLEDSIED